jgi:hypothetical protein
MYCTPVHVTYVVTVCLGKHNYNHSRPRCSAQVGKKRTNTSNPVRVHGGAVG